MYNVTGGFKPALMLMFTVEKNVVGYESSDYDKAERLRQSGSDYDEAKDYLTFFQGTLQFHLYIL
jgi:hypothetical protein